MQGWLRGWGWVSKALIEIEWLVNVLGTCGLALDYQYRGHPSDLGLGCLVGPSPIGVGHSMCTFLRVALDFGMIGNVKEQGWAVKYPRDMVLARERHELAMPIGLGGPIDRLGGALVDR